MKFKIQVERDERFSGVLLHSQIDLDGTSEEFVEAFESIFEADSELLEYAKQAIKNIEAESEEDCEELPLLAPAGKALGDFVRQNKG